MAYIKTRLGSGKESPWKSIHVVVEKLLVIVVSLGVVGQSLMNVVFARP